MAAGFSESYIRLWSLKGEKLKGMRSDFSSSSIRDGKSYQTSCGMINPEFAFLASSLQKIREKKGSTTRKLIGHSGPVYSVAFDPLSGSVASPKYLLSASADATTRLWSMHTMTNVVAFRGHDNPVWDVKWSPMGIYFATASRDRTARLWSTDRTSCLRVYAGHLSDVDVCFLLAILMLRSLISCSFLHCFTLVCAISSEFLVSCYWIKRLDCETLGCSTRFMCKGIHRTPGHSSLARP